MGSIRGSSYYTIVDGYRGRGDFGGWNWAEENAIALGGHLVTINDSAENEFLSSTVRAAIISTYNLRYGSGVQSGSAGQWRYNPLIGFSDSQQEGNRNWADGQSTSYTKRLISDFFFHPG